MAITDERLVRWTKLAYLLSSPDKIVTISAAVDRAVDYFIQEKFSKEFDDNNN